MKKKYVSPQSQAVRLTSSCTLLTNSDQYRVNNMTTDSETTIGGDDD